MIRLRPYKKSDAPYLLQWITGEAEMCIRDRYGAVSEQVASAMAEGVRKKSGCELGIGITGIAGPGGGTPEKPVGLVYIGLSDGQNTWVRKMPGTGKVKSRAYLRRLATSNALDMVRRYLSGLDHIEVAAYKA